MGDPCSGTTGGPTAPASLAGRRVSEGAMRPVRRFMFLASMSPSGG